LSKNAVELNIGTPASQNLCMCINLFNSDLYATGTMHMKTLTNDRQLSKLISPYLERFSRKPCSGHGNGTDHGSDLCSCACGETPSTSLWTDINKRMTDKNRNKQKNNSNKRGCLFKKCARQGASDQLIALAATKNASAIYYGILSKTVSHAGNSCLCHKMQNSIAKTPTLSM